MGCIPTFENRTPPFRGRIDATNASVWAINRFVNHPAGSRGNPHGLLVEENQPVFHRHADETRHIVDV